MSKLKQKSEINAEAARLLHTKGLFPSVIHCAYYACVQLMMHIISVRNIRVLNEEIVLNNSRGSHENLINSILKVIIRNEDKVSFNRKILELKKLRVMADYRNEDIFVNQSQKSLELSDEVVRQLKRMFL